jgi:hypothetical protein
MPIDIAKAKYETMKRDIINSFVNDVCSWAAQQQRYYLTMIRNYKPDQPSFPYSWAETTSSGHRTFNYTRLLF